jgi:hypothetical protein
MAKDIFGRNVKTPTPSPTAKEKRNTQTAVISKSVQQLRKESNTIFKNTQLSPKEKKSIFTAAARSKSPKKVARNLAVKTQTVKKALENKNMKLSKQEKQYFALLPSQSYKKTPRQSIKNQTAQSFIDRARMKSKIKGAKITSRNKRFLIASATFLDKNKKYKFGTTMVKLTKMISELEKLYEKQLNKNTTNKERNVIYRKYL